MKGKYTDWVTPEKLLKIEAWARDGLTDEQIASNMGIARSTLNTWKKNYPVIMATLKRGKEVVDIQVENALLKRALGYKYTEVTRERIINGQGKSELIVTKEVTKEILPDTTAQIFWLKNRRPDKWRNEKIEVNMNLPVFMKGEDDLEE